VTGPIDVIQDGVTGALDPNLARAAERAVSLDPQVCRQHALSCGWDRSTRLFEGNLVMHRGAGMRHAIDAAADMHLT
jgi:hypothetical protein